MVLADGLPQPALLGVAVRLRGRVGEAAHQVLGGRVVAAARVGVVEAVVRLAGGYVRRQRQRRYRAGRLDAFGTLVQPLVHQTLPETQVFGIFFKKLFPRGILHTSFELKN